MSFESYIRSTIDKNQRDSFVRYHFANTLAAYFGDDKYNIHFAYDCLAGHFYKSNNGECRCSIDELNISIPNDFSQTILALIDARTAYFSKSYALDCLWNLLNKDNKQGLFFPIILGEDSLYFLFCREIKKRVIDNITTNYSDYLDSFPVFREIIVAEILYLKNKKHTTENTILTKEAEIIDHVLQGENLPDIQMINSLANLKYENQSNEGILCFVETNYTTSINFTNPQPLAYEEIRALRKYFQMSGENLYLLAERYTPGHPARASISRVWMIRGLGTCNNPIAKLYFSSGKKWRLIINREELGCDGAHFFAKLQSDRKQLMLDDLSYFCSEKSIRRLTKIVERLIKQKHGTMLVISSIAKNESKRLGDLRRAISITKFNLNNLSDQEMIMISSIDGCIIVDKQGNCTAIGAILDGEANIATDIGRGARFNSALTYIKKLKDQNEEAAAIVISEDGSIDIVTTKSIHQQITYYEQMKFIEEMDYLEYRENCFIRQLTGDYLDSDVVDDDDFVDYDDYDVSETIDDPLRSNLPSDEDSSIDDSLEENIDEDI